jgi:hypothetical protein
MPGLQAAASFWSYIHEEQRAHINTDNFAVSLMFVWEATFTVKPTQLPLPPEKPVPNLQRILHHWLHDRPEGTSTPIIQAIQAGMPSPPPSRRKRLCQSNVTPPEGDGIITSTPDMSPECMDELMGPLPPTIGADLKCPSAMCAGNSTNPWALSTHYNTMHTGDIPPTSATLSALGVNFCKCCSEMRPVLGQCPSCPSYIGSVAWRIMSGEMWSENTEAMESEEEGKEEGFMDKLLASYAPTVPHIPRFARKKFGELLANELNSFACHQTEELMQRILLLPQSILASSRGGRKRSRAMEARMQQQLDTWATGDVEAAWETFTGSAERRDHARKLRESSGKATKDDNSIPDSVINSVVSLTNQGLPGKACKLLLSDGIAIWNKATRLKIQSLFPAGNPEKIPAMTTEADPFTEEEITSAMKRMGRGKAPGPSGLRTEHLNDLLHDDLVGEKVLEALTRFVNTVAFGGCSRSLAGMLCAGRVVPLEKKGGGIRPLVVGESLRNLVATCWLGRVGARMEEKLQPRHLGLGRLTGVENAVHRARLATSHLRPNEAAVKIDFANAYNTVDRRAMVEAVSGRCPELAGWASWTLGCRAILAAGEGQVECANGVQQGDPMSPLIFSITMAEIASVLEVHFKSKGKPLEQQWYLDDGLFLLKTADVPELFNVLHSTAGSMGLALNRSKSEILGFGDLSTLAATTGAPALNNRYDWTYLGCPLSYASTQHPSFQAAIERHKKLEARIGLVDDPQAQLALWRQCMGACRILHLTATCPGSETAHITEEVAAGMRRGLDTIMAAKTSDKVYSQSTLPVREGGLGLQDPRESNDEAHFVSL